MSGYFCPETIFNLSNRVLADTKIKALEKGLDFAPIQKKWNEPELRSDFNEFCRRMRLKWHFRDESENFSEVLVFIPKPSLSWGFLKSSWLFKLSKADIKYSNLSREEWNAIKYLADDKNIIIKKADVYCYLGLEWLLNGSRKTTKW